MTTDEKGTAMRVPPSRDDDTPSERTPEPARVHRQMPNSLAPTACPCASCVAEAGVSAWWMIVCDECGNKRCPHGTDHRHECTGSNEPGQVGSGYARMTSDAHIETITDPAAIRATDEPDERGDFPCCTTPAPVGAAVALDLDAAHVRTDPACTFHDGATPKASRGKSCPACMRLDLDAIEAKANDVRHVSFPSGDVILALVAEVRRLTEERARWRTEALGHAENVRGVTELAHRWRLRAESAEAKVAAAEAVADALTTAAKIERLGERADVGELIEAIRDDLRAALATTGEGE